MQRRDRDRADDPDPQGSRGSAPGDNRPDEDGATAPQAEIAAVPTAAGDPDEDEKSSVLWGVGAVSQRLGIATPTLRTWDRRYGLGPSIRTEGGHRRYSELDVARVARMSQLIAEGVPPSQAAQVSQRSVHDAAAVLSRGPRALPHTTVTGRGVSMTIAAMLRAVRDLDSATLAKMLSQTFDRRGLVGGWSDVVAPLLVAVGDEWARGDIGVECEHLASECVQTELRYRIRAGQARRSVTAPVLLASAADEQHALALFALAAVLTEHRVSIRVLAARTPTPALVAAIERTAPRVVFLWSSLQATGLIPRLPTAGRTDVPALVLGGPGWDRLQLQPVAQGRVVRVADLSGAAQCITTMVG
jgi:DNA-binding transcriptional MerR regulator